MKLIKEDGIAKVVSFGATIVSGDFDFYADGWFMSAESDKGQTFCGTEEEIISFALQSLNDQMIADIAKLNATRAAAYAAKAF